MKGIYVLKSFFVNRSRKQFRKKAYHTCLLFFLFDWHQVSGTNLGGGQSLDKEFSTSAPWVIEEEISPSPIAPKVNVEF